MTCRRPSTQVLYDRTPRLHPPPCLPAYLILRLPEFKPGYIGDNYVWSESRNTATSVQHTFYVLSGSTRCAEGHPWCSYRGLGGNTTAQSFLFRSLNLLDWEFVSQFDGQEVVGGKPQQHIDTPDTFRIRPMGAGDATQAYVWLSQGGSPACEPTKDATCGCRTVWQVGALDNESMSFVAKQRVGKRGPSAIMGCADRGAMFCQQSLTTAQGSRVSFGWIGLNLGAGWDADGAQTVGRQITSDAYGLVYTPLPALESLHADFQFLTNHPLVAGAGTQAAPDLTALSAWEGRVHLKLDLQLADPVGGPDDAGGVVATSDADESTGWWLTDGSAASANYSSVVTLSLLGGAVKLSLGYSVAAPPPAPPAAQCENQPMTNNSDATGKDGFGSPLHPPSHEDGPAWCRQQCCKHPGCTAWVYTDPQPGPKVNK
jgi:hypothetical protein